MKLSSFEPLPDTALEFRAKVMALEAASQEGRLKQPYPYLVWARKTLLEQIEALHTPTFSEIKKADLLLGEPRMVKQELERLHKKGIL